MGRISIDDILPGMVLASDVKDKGGRTLLGAGNELSDRHLQIFKTWGIVDADIVGADREELASKSLLEIDPQLLEEAQHETEKVFRHADLSHPAVKELYRLAIQTYAKKKARGAVNAS